MGNVFCKNIETDPRDMQNKEILETRKRYLDEQFIQDVEKEPEKATPDAIENTGHFCIFLIVLTFHFTCINYPETHYNKRIMH